MFESLTSMFGRSERELLCPYCFRDFRLSEAPFRCDTGVDRCAWESDAIFAREWKDASLRGKILPASNRNVATCPECRNESLLRCCPHCHMDLPPQLANRNRSLVFSVIGAKGTGKSHYLAVLIAQIQEYLEGPLGFTMGWVDDYTNHRYRQKFRDPLFKGKLTLDQTRSATNESDVSRPLLYELTFPRPKGAKVAPTVLLAFFDTAGEDMNEEAVMATVNRYIYRSDGVILLLDPLQLDHVRAELDGRVALPEQATEINDIVQRTSNLIRKGRRLPPGAPIPIPLAVTFSKIDAVEDLLGGQSAVIRTPRYDRGYDVADGKEVSRELKSTLLDWKGGHVLRQVETRFPTHQLFGLSALGCNPQAGVVPRVTPHRVADPFLWLLHCNGLVKTAPKA